MDVGRSLDVETTDPESLDSEGDEKLSDYSEALEDNCTSYSQHPVDEGYAWVTLAISFLIQAAGPGTALSMGTFTPTLIAEFNGSRDAVGLVGSIHIGCVFFGGPLAGMLTEKFGYRAVMIGGALLSSTGVALGAAATQVWLLYLTVGFAGGIGICFTYIPSVTLLAHYFNRWKNISFSISAAGVGIGTLMMPLYMRWLIERYGWRGAYLLTAGVILQIVVCAAWVRDPVLPVVVSNRNRKLAIKSQLSALCNWRFNLFLINNYLFNVGSLIVFVYISDYAELKGMSSVQGVYLISIIGISNAIGRLINIPLSLCHCNRGYAYTISCTLSGVAVALINIRMVCPDVCFIQTAIACSIYGALFGIQLGNLAIVTHMLTEENYLNSAFGLVMLLNGIGAVSGPPIAALVYRLGGDNFELSFYVAGGSIVLSGLVLLPMLYTNRAVSSTRAHVEPT